MFLRNVLIDIHFYTVHPGEFSKVVIGFKCDRGENINTPCTKIKLRIEKCV